jgi:hypothetical protein
MKNFILSVAIISFVAAPALLVAGDSSKSTPPSTVSGCLNGPNEDGTFTLQRVKAGDVHVGGLENLKDHVGQQVRLRGLWVGSGGQIGEKESTANKVEDTVGTRKHFRPTAVEKISDRCDEIH